MCKRLHFFQTNGRSTAVAYPFDFEEIVHGWHSLRNAMVRSVPSAFTRDEWAYLISFLDKENLYEPVKKTFGDPVNNPDNAVESIARPRGRVALWLPNNVSLLGPLMLILLSLSGNSIRVKGGSRSEDLTGAFLGFALKNLHEAQLKAWLETHVRIEFFDRDDPRNEEMAATSDIRIVFGSDEAAIAIDAMPHPVESEGIYFVDRQSEAWVEKDALDDQLIEMLVKVFAIYGQAGCTSPRKVVVLGGTKEDAVELKNRIVKAWPKIVTRVPAQHIASDNIMARQWAAAIGWEASLTESNGAVVAAGADSLQMFSSFMSLPIVWATLEHAVNSLPENIQTIGHAVKDSKNEHWLMTLAGTKVKRFVPVASMHHFSHVWDGYAFWRQLFEEVEVQV